MAHMDRSLVFLFLHLFNMQLITARRQCQVVWLFMTTMPICGSNHDTQRMFVLSGSTNRQV